MPPRKISPLIHIKSVSYELTQFFKWFNDEIQKANVNGACSTHQMLRDKIALSIMNGYDSQLKMIIHFTTKSLIPPILQIPVLMSPVQLLQGWVLKNCGSIVSHTFRHIYDNGVGSCMVGGFTIGRRIPDFKAIVPDESGDLRRDSNEDMSYVLSAQCKDGGAIKWIDGPYTCTGSNCLRTGF